MRDRLIMITISSAVDWPRHFREIAKQYPLLSRPPESKTHADLSAENSFAGEDVGGGGGVSYIDAAARPALRNRVRAYSSHTCLFRSNLPQSVVGIVNKSSRHRPLNTSAEVRRNGCSARKTP